MPPFPVGLVDSLADSPVSHPTRVARFCLAICCALALVSVSVGHAASSLLNAGGHSALDQPREADCLEIPWFKMRVWAL